MTPRKQDLLNHYVQSSHGTQKLKHFAQGLHWTVPRGPVYILGLIHWLFYRILECENDWVPSLGLFSLCVSFDTVC